MRRPVPDVRYLPYIALVDHVAFTLAYPEGGGERPTDHFPHTFGCTLDIEGDEGVRLAELDRLCWSCDAVVAFRHRRRGGARPASP